MMQTLEQEHLNRWHQHVEVMEWAYNNTIYRATGHTNFFLRFGTMVVYWWISYWALLRM